jgi:hypothetical protein
MGCHIEKKLRKKKKKGLASQKGFPDYYTTPSIEHRERKKGGPGSS